MAPTTPPHAELPLTDESETEALAARLAGMCGRGDILALTGDLGVGKTVFARAFIRACTHADEEVPSPTFTLLQVYETSDDPIHHFDLYRLRTAEEVLELGFDDALHDGVTLVEWPDRLGPYLPRDRLDVKLLQGPSAVSRLAHLTGHGYWEARMTDAFLDGAIHG